MYLILKFSVCLIPVDGINICELRDNYGRELKLIGKFLPLYTTKLYDFNIATCYKENENKWHFSAQDNKVNIRAILGICLQNLDTDAVKIFDFSDLYRKFLKMK